MHQNIHTSLHIAIMCSFSLKRQLKKYEKYYNFMDMISSSKIFKDILLLIVKQFYCSFQNKHFFLLIHLLEFI